MRKRKFSSYGPVDNELHYHVPRTALRNYAYNQLIGENPDKGGHFVTVWAPRQTGKTWLLNQVGFRIKKMHDFDIVNMSVGLLKDIEDADKMLPAFIELFQFRTEKEFPQIDDWPQLSGIFTKKYWTKPFILILDEFDALGENSINKFANVFREIYLSKKNEQDKKPGKKTYMLHGLALIGVRSVLGIENQTGSPFNVQRSIHIPNLTFEETVSMFEDYQEEHNQQIDPGVIHQLYYETNGQPGLVSWFGELLTEKFNTNKHEPIKMDNWEETWAAAIQILPSNNALNLISKAKEEKETVLELFKTTDKIEFAFDSKKLNHLFMNGIITYEKIKESKKTNFYIKFANPFIQKRLFNYFSNEYFNHIGHMVDPFDEMKDAVTEDNIHIPNLMKRYQAYLNKNKTWLFRDLPRRHDLCLYEAYYHFNLYRFLSRLLEGLKVHVIPEFPTGNGKIDLLLRYKDKLIGIELKSFTDTFTYKDSLRQAAGYAKSLDLKEINLIFFVEAHLSEQQREKYEKPFFDEHQIKVIPCFVEIAD